MIQFFKMVVKRFLNLSGNAKEVEYLTEIMFNCKSNNEMYFSLGLISMLVELINRDKDGSFSNIL